MCITLFLSILLTIGRNHRKQSWGFGTVFLLGLLGMALRLGSEWFLTQMLPLHRTATTFPLYLTIVSLLAPGHHWMDHPGILSSKVPSLWRRNPSSDPVWQMFSWHLPKTALYSEKEDTVCPLPWPLLHRQLAHQWWVCVLQPSVQGAAVREAGVQPHPQPRLWMWGRALPGARILLEAQELSARLRSGAGW